MINNKKVDIEYFKKIQEAILNKDIDKIKDYVITWKAYKTVEINNNCDIENEESVVFYDLLRINCVNDISLYTNNYIKRSLTSDNIDSLKKLISCYIKIIDLEDLITENSLDSDTLIKNYINREMVLNE